MVSLSAAEKQVLVSASSREVQLAFGRVGAALAGGEWLNTANAYAHDLRGVLRQHTRGGRVNVRSGDLAEYIAVSAPIHCQEGWSFLGRALDSHIRGDLSAVVHLAYYAQLRAAMSLLAAAGIGVFDDRHFVVVQGGNCETIGVLDHRGKSKHGTHQIAWLALEYWSSLPASGELIGEAITPGFISFEGWLDAFETGSMVNTVGARWLKDWGLDLARLAGAEDQRSRNQASYRPTIVRATPLPLLETSKFLREFWGMFEPTASSRFTNLDRYLLRTSLRTIWNALPGATRRPFEARLTEMLDKLFADQVLIAEWLKFLKADAQSDPSLLIQASGREVVGQPHHHLQVISRACILLRLATGACVQLLRSAPYGSAELEFWWKAIGDDRGIWAPGSEPDQMIDLWDDIFLSIDDLEVWDNKQAGSMPSHKSWRESLALPLSLLGECERIALWGMGL